MSFGAIKKLPDDYIEIFYYNYYVLLGCLGGVNGARGEHLEFDGLDCDFDKLDEVLTQDIKDILNKDLDVIWISN